MAKAPAIGDFFFLAMASKCHFICILDNDVKEMGVLVYPIATSLDGNL